MTATYHWYASAISKGSDLTWNAGREGRRCDEIRFAFIADHLGMNTQYSGPLFADFSYYDASKSTSVRVHPKLAVVVGDKSTPSTFTIQGVIKFDRPIEIKPSTLVTLFMSTLPNADAGTSTITLASKWFTVIYYLRGNEDSGKNGA